MLEENKTLFDSFQKVHSLYVLQPDKNRQEFNQIGQEVQNIIRHWENKLCGHSERGQYGKFSANLSEKFQDEVRKLFPKINEVGLKVIDSGFSIKKINLF